MRYPTGVSDIDLTTLSPSWMRVDGDVGEEGEGTVAGAALAVGDVLGDANPDLVIGDPGGTNWAVSVGRVGVFPVAPQPSTVVPAVARITALPMYLSTTTVRVTWGATAHTSPVASFDVRHRRALWNGGFGGYATWRGATPATSATFTGAKGSTYCFSARARDTGGLASAWTGETCTAIPLDDRSLTRSGSWTAGTGSAYYQSTYLRSSTSGAKLTRTGVVAKRIALLATTCRTCGTVKLYWGSTLLKTISLYSKATVNKKLMTVATFTSARSGTLKIKVYSSGKKVIIDGVAIRRN